MSNKNLPTGWGNQQSYSPKGWRKSPSEHKKTQLPDNVVEDACDTQPKSNEIDNSQSNNYSTNTARNQDKTVDDIESEITPASEEETTDNSKEYKDSYEKFAVQEVDEDKRKNNHKSSEDKKPKTLRISTLFLAVALTATISFLIVFICLYFSSNNENKTDNADVISKIETTISDTEETITKPTEVASTAVETTNPIETTVPKVKPTTAKPKNNSASQPFESYLIWLNVGVYVHEKPDPTSNVTYVIDTATNYTIVDESYDEYGDLWGKLKSGVGWVNLSLADMVTGYDTDTSFFNPKYHSDIKTKQVGNITFLYRSQANHADDNSYSENIDSLSISEINSTTYHVAIDGEIIGNAAGFSKNIRFVEMDSNFKYLGNNYPIAPDMPNHFHYKADLHIMNNNTSDVFILLEVF